MALPADGTILATGAPFHAGEIGNDSGNVQVYARDVSDNGTVDWNLVGNSIDGWQVVIDYESQWPSRPMA